MLGRQTSKGVQVVDWVGVTIVDVDVDVNVDDEMSQDRSRRRNLRVPIDQEGESGYWIEWFVMEGREQ